jgi:acetamidase/formamidase
MDCPEITIGATVLLPIEHEGALLYFGDCKAVMADGEITQPPEVGTLITASAAIRDKPKTMRSPRVETEESLVTIVSAQTIGDACRAAYREMLNWLESDYGMDRSEAATLMAMVAQPGLCQITSILETAKCIMPRRWLT